ncbi:VCBS repeat-containing protein [Nakamurella sp. A5-74]|uniref:VCBS repeat-containing protein n=1 Tax=Nakamurella sp. A5-74 TaxID=3158264 RepID=A0AAU8DLV6_9ACTN
MKIRFRHLTSVLGVIFMVSVGVGTPMPVAAAALPMAERPVIPAAAPAVQRHVDGGQRYGRRALQYAIGASVGDPDAWERRVVREAWNQAGIADSVPLTRAILRSGSLAIGDFVSNSQYSEDFSCDVCPDGPHITTTTTAFTAVVTSINPVLARGVMTTRTSYSWPDAPVESYDISDLSEFSLTSSGRAHRYPMPLNRALGAAGVWYSTLQPAGTAVAGDWNADGVDDVGAAVDSGFLVGGARSVWGYGLTRGDVPVTGDWNGDGRDDVGVYRGTQFLLATRAANGAVTRYRTTTWGRGTTIGGDVPVVGDWNGDGVDDVGVYRGTQFLLALNTSAGAKAYRTVSFGQGVAHGDLPVVGDWNGDGVDDLAVVRGGAGSSPMTYVMGLVSATDGKAHGYRTVAFAAGVANDQPLAGDWNGDGRDEPALTNTGATVFLSTLRATGSSATLYKRVQLTAPYAVDALRCTGTGCGSIA